MTNPAGVTVQELFGNRRLQFGRNFIEPPKQVPFYMLAWDALQDRTLQILCVAAAVSIAIGIYEEIKQDQAYNDAIAHGSTPPQKQLGEWVEGLAILIAVIIIVLINSYDPFCCPPLIFFFSSR